MVVRVGERRWLINKFVRGRIKKFVKGKMRKGNEMIVKEQKSNSR